MGRRARGQLPQMRLHKRSGTARVRVNGQEIQLGRWDAEETRVKFLRVIQDLIRQEDLAVGSSRPSATTPPEPAVNQPEVDGQSSSQGEVVSAGADLDTQSAMTIADMCAAFHSYAEKYYVKPDGKPSSTLGNYSMAIRALEPYFGIPARGFGPRLLRRLRDDLVQQKGRRKGPNGERRPKFRKTINRTVAGVCWIFKWAVSMEYVPAEVYQALRTLEPLREGRTPAPELPKIKAVAEEDIDKTIACLPEIVADMVRVQRLLACRPTELCTMRPCDIDRSQAVWVYSPPYHKNAWRDQVRRVRIGPKAQAILAAYLDRPSMRPCFTPAESESRRNALRRRQRKSPMTPSHRARRQAVRRRLDPDKPYTDDSYREAIERACKKAGVPKWSPNQLRHTAAEEARREFGLDAAQARLGHKHAKITEVYAKQLDDKAIDVARVLG